MLNSLKKKLEKKEKPLFLIQIFWQHITVFICEFMVALYLHYDYSYKKVHPLDKTVCLPQFGGYTDRQAETDQ